MKPNPNAPRVLIADDQRDVLESLRLLLKGEGYQIEAVTSPAAVFTAVEAGDFDCLLMDLNYARDTTSGEEGLNLLARLQSLDNTLPVVVMTAWGSVELAVEAMRRGARDFIQKPWENARLLAILRTQIELSQALRRGQRLEAENRLLRAEGRPQFIAESRAMQPVRDLIARVGPSEANVLITGEHGTGKEVVAVTLHALGHQRRPQPRRDRGALPRRPPVSHQYRGNSTAATSGSPGRHSASGAAFPASPHQAVSEGCDRLRCGRHAGPAGSSLAGQRS